MHKRSKNELRREFDEQGIRALVLEALEPDFTIFDEVWLRSRINEPFRIDAVAIDKKCGYRIGLEFKFSFLFPSEFADALRQAINYRDSIIDDGRLQECLGQQLDCCVVCPGWDGMHDDGQLTYASEAVGMRRLAEKFRVGVFDRDYSGNGFCMLMGQSAIWHSRSGWTGNAEGVLRGKRRRGSGSKRFDPSRTRGVPT